MLAVALSGASMGLCYKLMFLPLLQLRRCARDCARDSRGLVTLSRRQCAAFLLSKSGCDGEDVLCDS